jgi:hypothetical protein
MKLGEMDLEVAAKEARGNWRHFESFCWHRASDLADADDWCIVYTHHRDSELLDQSNAAAIEAAMGPFMDGKDTDVVAEHHHHWAVGWIEGYSIRVFRRGRITKAFRRYHELAVRLADYPVLDEEHYSQLEYDATIANLSDASWRLKRQYDLPENWQGEVYNWFADNDCAAIESADDRGAYATEEQLRAAFDALGYGQVAAV